MYNVYIICIDVTMKSEKASFCRHVNLSAVFLPGSCPTLTVHTVVGRVRLLGVVLQRQVSVKLCSVRLFQPRR